MGDATDPPRPPASDAPAGPAADLAEVWKLLDELPSVRAGVDLAATTVDLVAAKVAGTAASPDRGAAGPRAWALRTATVAAALVAGFAAGRALAPDPDREVLQRLPLIEHLGMLREAGSIEFLEAMAERMDGRQGAARWLRFARDPQELQSEARQFDAAIEALRTEGVDAEIDDERLAVRRRRVASLPAAARAELERSAEAFDDLSSHDRSDVERLARTLVAPANERLVNAARLWHVIVASMNPVFRRSVVEMPAAERLEVMERSPGRFEPRPPGRPRDDFRERRPPEFRDDALPPRPRPPRGRGDGPPRPVNAPGPAGGRPAFGPPEPPPAADPPAAPGETRAPPG